MTKMGAIVEDGSRPTSYPQDSSSSSKKKSHQPYIHYGLVRSYMNGAVYVESPADSSDACFQDSSKETCAESKAQKQYQIKQQYERVTRKLVKCTCTTSDTCNAHASNNVSTNSLNQLGVGSGRRQRSARKNAKTKEESSDGDQLQQHCGDEESKNCLEKIADCQEALDVEYKDWTKKKAEEKKKMKERMLQIQQEEKELKQKQLERERANFKRWLAQKKKEVELKEKHEKGKLEVKERAEREKKEQKEKESQLKFQLWLKKKEEQTLKNRIKEQMKMIKAANDKKERMEKNGEVYKSWLEESKFKPKPVSSGQGLESLKSATSIPFVNPIPWVGNSD